MQYHYLFEGADFRPGPEDDKTWFGAAEFRHYAEAGRLLGRYCSNYNYARRPSQRSRFPADGDFFVTRKQSDPAKGA